jgi:O-acetyl-ADP-ribose deacetylase (regulator of RNase III)
MSVKHIKGDLLDFPQGINCIAHSSNCCNVMGSGIARQIKERYPVAFEADTKAARAGENRLGLLSVAKLEDGKRIVNLYTQAVFGRELRYVSYEGFYKALEHLKELLENAAKEGRQYTLGLPYKISCGYAGGDWRIIETMIHVLFDESPIEVYIVEKEDAK